jgi:hypothetical protein
LNQRFFSLVWIGLLSGCTPLVVWQGFSPDLTQCVQIRSGWNGQWVEVDGKPGRQFQAVATRGLRFSKNGERLAYPVRIDPAWASNDKRLWAVHEHNNQTTTFWRGIGSLAFSPDGKHLAYSAQVNNGWRVALNGKAGPRFAGVSDLMFSADSSTLVYVAGNKKGQSIVLNHVPGRRYRAIAALAVGPRGQRIVAIVRHNRRWHVSDNGRLGPSYKAIDALFLSKDGKHLAVIVRDNVGARVIVNGKPGANFDKIRRVNFHFSDTGKAVYIGRRNELDFPVFGEETGGGFDRLDPPVTVGDRLAYIAHSPEGSHVIVDGNTIASAVFARDLTISPNGLRTAYVLRRGADVAVVVDSHVHPFELVVPGSLTFSEDGQTWGCLIGRISQKRLFVVVNGDVRQEVAFAEFMIALQVQPDGRPTRRKRIVALKKFVAKVLAQ